MSIWSRIGDALASLARGDGIAQLFDLFRNPPEKSVAFTIAVIALGAKMAKADGIVTRDEVAAFREVFAIAAGEEANAARLFNLARQDVAGFESYAGRIARMFPDPRHQVLEDLIEGLFHVAMADGNYHEREDAFLGEVARILGLTEGEFQMVRARAVPDQHPDPYAVIGIDPDASFADIRTAWKAAVRDCHPDRLRARGLPDEAVGLGELRLRALNRAWAEIEAAHAHRNI